jgi:hypothetical protein
MRWICLTLLAGGVLLGGCGGSARPRTAAQEKTFAAFERLYARIQEVPDAAARERLMTAARGLESQIVFHDTEVPSAARLLLVDQIEIESRTQVGDWDNDGQADGFEVFVTARDGLGDPTKIIGKVYFELFRFRQAHADPRQLERVAYWPVDIMTGQQNAAYWNRFDRDYHFKLVWHDLPDVGEKYILQVTYVAPWGDKRDSQRVMTRTPEPGGQ